jgi:spore maturation protein CgeB
MKILYVGAKYDYGKPERGFSYEYQNFYDTLGRMNGRSNKIIDFFFDEIILKEGLARIDEKLIENIKEEKPELVFFAGIGPMKKETIKEVTAKSGAKTLVWFSDDHWQFEKLSKYWAPLFNWVVTTDAEAVPKYHKIGYKNVILSQWACNHFLYKPLNLPKIYDVTFIGAPHGNRKKIIEKIKKAGINVKCWGSGWPEGRVSQEEMLRIFSQSKINLNFTKSSGVIWKELASIFFHRNYNRSIGINNPKYWLDNLKSLPPAIWSKQIKGRNFEIPGCGGFLLTEYASHLEDYYKIGKEIECFKNISELIEKIKYYLVNEKEREKIAEAGYERTLKDHTYEKRFNEIFKTMDLIK